MEIQLQTNNWKWVSFESEEKKVCIYFKCIFYVYFSSITHFCKAVKMVLCQLI